MHDSLSAGVVHTSNLWGWWGTSLSHHSHPPLPFTVALYGTNHEMLYSVSEGGDTSADAPTISNWTSISDPCWTRVPPTISPMLFCAGWMGGCHPPPPNLVPNHSVIDHMGYDAPPMVKIEDLPISAVFPSQQHRSAPGQPG